MTCFFDIRNALRLSLTWLEIKSKVPYLNSVPNWFAKSKTLILFSCSERQFLLTGVSAWKVLT